MTKNFMNDLKTLENKTKLMAEFYEKCQKNGYTDMTDATQSLKAKVIATDLNLNYKDIAKFYEKAKECYEIVEKEKKEESERKRLAEIAAKEDAKRRAVDGKLLVVISTKVNKNGSGTDIGVYIRPDKSIYCTIDDEDNNKNQKIEGAPDVTVEKGQVGQYTYHPSQAIYTGASVGGISMGGVHYTKDGYSYGTHGTDKGDVNVTVGGKKYYVKRIITNEFTNKKFKRDSEYMAMFAKLEKICFRTDSIGDMFTDYAMKNYSVGSADFLNTMSIAVDQNRLDYNECVKISNVLYRIVNFKAPLPDEELYNNAIELSKRESTKEIGSAISIFKAISDYRDSAELLKKTEKKYEDVLQREKEQKIIEKEKKQMERKTALKIAGVSAAVFVVIGIVALIMLTISNKRYEYRVNYEAAITLLESGEYEQAIEKFEELGDCDEKIREICYRQGKVALENELFDDAITFFEKAGEYKDGKAMLSESKYLKAESLRYSEGAVAKSIYIELGDYKDAKKKAACFSEEKLLIKRIADWGENSYHYENGKLVSVIFDVGDSIESKTVFEYSDEGKLIRETNKSSNYDGEEIYEYDNNGNCIKHSYPQTSLSPDVLEVYEYKYEYYPNGNKHIETEIYSRWNSETEEYLIEPHVLYVETYSESGDSSVIENKHGKNIKIKYDRYGNIIRIEREGESSDDIEEYEYEYTVDGKILRVSNKQGMDATYKYDEDGNLIRIEGLYCYVDYHDEISYMPSFNDKITVEYIYDYIYTGK